MKEIKLDPGSVALVDDADYEWLNQHKWYARWDKTTQSFYAQRGVCLGQFNGKQKNRAFLMHREILGIEHGDPRKGDHKEPTETLNNQRSNLRIAENNSESNANRRMQTNNTTGYKGVVRRGGRYLAQIYKNGKRKYLGIRDTPEAAHALYVKAALELHGEFARLA